MAERVGVVPPPPGVKPDFDCSNPWLYQSSKVIVVVGLILSTSCLILRVYTKVYLVRKFGFDDVFIVLAWICGAATQTCSSYGYKHGIGTHMWNLTPDMFNTYMKTIVTGSVIYVPCLTFAKISLIIFYYRILHQQGLYHWVLYLLTVILAGFGFAIIFALIFGCNPIQKSWDASIVGGHCIDKNSLFISIALVNILTDFVLILLPIPTILSLNMPRIQKIGILFMFTIGCATVVTSIIRLVVLLRFLGSTDPTYTISSAALWVNVEANLIIICGCLPFLRNFLRHYAPRCIGEGSNSTSMGSTPRGKRKQGLTRLQDELEFMNITEPADEGDVEGWGIRKDENGEVTAKQSMHPSESAGSRQAESVLTI